MSLFIHRGAEISGEYRYRLWRTWSEGNRILLWIMLNPSTADANVDDATIRRCVAFSRREDYDGLRVCNLFAYRSTDPKKLLGVTDPIGPGNDDTILSEAAGSTSVMAAWGCPPRGLEQRAQDVLALLQRHKYTVFCLGQTREGHPRHPVRLAAATRAGVLQL